MGGSGSRALKCPHCLTDNDADARICGQCGNELPTRRTEAPKGIVDEVTQEAGRLQQAERRAGRYRNPHAWWGLLLVLLFLWLLQRTGLLPSHH